MPLPLLFIGCPLTCGRILRFITRSHDLLNDMMLTQKQLPTLALLLGFCLVFSGCLKTQITTDRTSSNQQAELEWAHGFVNGLVPPVNAPLRAQATCGEDGVSEVYFRQTFVQLVAQGITAGIYSPQRFTATCATGGGMSSNQTPPEYLLRDSAVTPSSWTHATSDSTPDAK